MFNVSAYIPEALLPQYEALRDSLFSWLKVLGVVHADNSDKSAGKCHRAIPVLPLSQHYLDTSRAKQALHDAERALNTVVKQKSDAEEDLAHLFDPEWYGREGEWRKLDGTCISKDTGECVPRFASNLPPLTSQPDLATRTRCASSARRSRSPTTAGRRSVSGTCRHRSFSCDG